MRARFPAMAVNIQAAKRSDLKRQKQPIWLAAYPHNSLPSAVVQKMGIGLVTSVAAARPERTTLGVILIVAAVFMMSIQDSLIKHFSTDLSLWQTFTLRGLIAIPLLFLVGLATGEGQRIWFSAFGRWPLMRSLFLTLMFMALYGAMPFLSLSTIAAGIYTGPIFVTLLSVFAIGEPVGTRGWIAIALGFSGVLIILQPGSDAFTYWALLPVLGGFLYALSNITTRSQCQAVSPAALAMSLNIALVLTSIAISSVILLWPPATDLSTEYPFLFGGWSAIGSSEWLLISLLAALVIGIGMALATAYQIASPPIVAAFDYSYLIFVALWDFLFFSTTPNTATVLGILLIVSAGFLILHRR